MIHGAATSSLQCEGAAPASDWSGWESAGWRPPSGDGNGFATQYADDAALLASKGLGALRITLEWARLEPRRRDALAVEEVARYRLVLEAIRAAGLQAWVTLAHTTLPGWFSEDERGFLDEGMARRVWPAHVDRVAEAFGDLVDGWVTFHEPVRYALDAWLLANLPPGRRDGDDAQSGLRLLQAADAEAARLLRVPGGAPVASCQWLPPLFPLEGTPECRSATASATSLLWDTWRDVDEHDWLGVSCSYAIGVGADGSFHPWPRTSTPNVLGWAAWPDAVDHTLERVANDRPGRPVVLLTGVTEGAFDVVADAAASVEQVHWWSAVDGYEGAAGFGLRSGLFDRDRNPTGIKELRLGSAGA